MRTIVPIIVTASLILCGCPATAASSQASPTVRLITDHGCVRDWSTLTNKLLMDERDEKRGLPGLYAECRRLRHAGDHG
jgi:hypothetical protein